MASSLLGCSAGCLMLPRPEFSRRQTLRITVGSSPAVHRMVWARISGDLRTLRSPAAAVERSEESALRRQTSIRARRTRSISTVLVAGTYGGTPTRRLGLDRPSRSPAMSSWRISSSARCAGPSHSYSLGETRG